MTWLHECAHCLTNDVTVRNEILIDIQLPPVKVTNYLDSMIVSSLKNHKEFTKVLIVQKSIQVTKVFLRNIVSQNMVKTIISKWRIHSIPLWHLEPTDRAQTQYVL